jgi:hypothetical protein
MTREEYGILHHLTKEMAEFRGSTESGIDDIKRRLTGLETNTDGLLSAYQQHGLRLGQMEALCQQRHRRDSDETRRLGNVDKRLTQLETNGVARQAMWKTLAKLGGLIVAAATGAAAIVQAIGG